jgi:hypothetical protein
MAANQSYVGKMEEKRQKRELVEQPAKDEKILLHGPDEEMEEDHGYYGKLNISYCIPLIFCGDGFDSGGNFFSHIRERSTLDSSSSELFLADTLDGFILDNEDQFLSSAHIIGDLCMPVNHQTVSRPCQEIFRY